MLPTVTLQGVSRDDVDRIGWWLQDDEISSRWFGHYACGDPVHRGYDPEHMLEAGQSEWDRVFNDPAPAAAIGLYRGPRARRRVLRGIRRARRR